MAPGNPPSVGRRYLFSDFSGLIIGLLVSFRLNFAYDKWERAMKCILDLHARSRLITSKLCAYTILDSEEKLERIAECRRWMVLACVLIKHHVRNDPALDDAISLLSLIHI